MVRNLLGTTLGAQPGSNRVQRDLEKAEAPFAGFIERGLITTNRPLSSFVKKFAVTLATLALAASLSLPALAAAPAPPAAGYGPGMHHAAELVELGAQLAKQHNEYMAKYPHAFGPGVGHGKCEVGKRIGGDMMGHDMGMEPDGTFYPILRHQSRIRAGASGALALTGVSRAQQRRGKPTAAAKEATHDRPRGRQPATVSWFSKPRLPSLP